jgi:predicted GNAT family acetyltransferase
MQNNIEQNRFELTEQGHVAYANYRIEGSTLFIDYVFAPSELRGSGAAGRLMQGVMEFAKTNNYEITPICGYAASWLKRNK